MRCRVMIENNINISKHNKLQRIFIRTEYNKQRKRSSIYDNVKTVEVQHNKNYFLEEAILYYKK